MRNKYFISSIMFMFTGLLSAQELELIGIVSHNNENYVGLKLDNGGKELSSFSVVKYNMDNGFNTTTTNATNYQFKDGYYLIPVDGNTETEYAYRIKALFTDNTELKSPNIEIKDGAKFHWLGSDLECTSYESGYKTPTIDRPIDGAANTPIKIDGINYYKSYSTHAYGSFTFYFDENTPYNRFYTKYGIMDDKSPGDVVFTYIINGEIEEQHNLYAKSNTSSAAQGPYIREYETTINGAKRIRIQGDTMDKDNGGDHMNFVMGRVYFKQSERKGQTVELPESLILTADKPFVYTINNVFSSGLEPQTRIVRGNEYATLDGRTLNITSIPEDKSEYIEVEMFQPGNEEFAPSQLYRCKYYIRNYKTVNKDEKLVLENGAEIDILTVYGDFKSAGQVVVESGFAKINKLVLKYTFIPGKWNFISFPGNFNIDEISNMNELGYFLNKSPKPYYIREYSTKARADGESAWTKLTTPEVRKNKGYLMGIARTADNPNSDPVEVTFTIDNTTLGVTSTSDGTMNVQLDMTMVPENEEVEVVVQPVDVKGIPLVVKVKFEPEEEVVKPLNFKNALEEARITFNPNKSGIRISLPENSPAKVMIFDKKGRLAKAVKYISPFVIDISDMKKGHYDVLIQYGNARSYKNLVIE